jgi:hypothetical protein
VLDHGRDEVRLAIGRCLYDHGISCAICSQYEGRPLRNQGEPCDYIALEWTGSLSPNVMVEIKALGL